jgi:hypothetical protein
MNYERITMEYVEDEAGGWLMLKGSGPKKIEKKIDHLK